MIKVKNLNKYFHKDKDNEIHAVNNVNFAFPETGLVCLLGPSGCGKTTLLNIIGGLDKPTSGTVEVAGKSVARYDAKRWDDIRNEHFGYVFQNYYLLRDLTVFENLEFVLKIYNLPKEEVYWRIEYALGAVGMFKFRKRYPEQLSVGQKQRVAIARALVKSPDIVVADEPTGNLDEKNKLQIMNIIKKISVRCLVILVTHERRLADIFGDIILELSDGRITDIRSVQASEHDYSVKEDRNLYLPEFQKRETTLEGLSVRYYYQDAPSPVRFDIIYHNGSYYFHSDDPRADIKVITPGSEIKVLDAERPTIKAENVRQFNYHLPPPRSRTIASSVMTYRDTFKMAWGRIRNMRRGQKFFLSVLVFAAVMVVFAFITYFSSVNVEEKDFLADNRNLISINGIKDYNMDDYARLMQELDADYILAPTGSVYLSQFQLEYFNQAPDNMFSFPNHSVLPVELYENNMVPLYGRMPENEYEAVIDKYLVNIMLEMPMIIQSGIRDFEQFLDMPYYCYYGYFRIEGSIVGIVDTGNPNIYMSYENYQELVINYANREETNRGMENIIKTPETALATHYYLFSEFGGPDPAAYEITAGSLGVDEILISKEYYAGLLPGQTTVRFDKEYTILGVVENWETIVHKDNLDNLYYFSLTGEPTIFVESDREAVLLRMESLGLEGSDIYNILYRQYYSDNFSFTKYIFAFVILSASLLFLYFLMRSRLIGSIYEVGVYRALGVKKSNIYRLFFTEIIELTMLTAPLGIIGSAYVINEINTLTPYSIVFFPWYIPFVSFAFIFAVNIISGMIPIYALLLRTPAEILNKYDI